MSNEGGVKIGVGFALKSPRFRVCESAHAGFLLLSQLLQGIHGGILTSGERRKLRVNISQHPGRCNGF